MGCSTGMWRSCVTDASAIEHSPKMFNNADSTCRSVVSAAARGARIGGGIVPKCSICKEDVDEVSVVKVHGRKKKVCEECLEVIEEEEAIAEESESVVQNMMGFKGRR